VTEITWLRSMMMALTRSVGQSISNCSCRDVSDEGNIVYILFNESPRPQPRSMVLC
jgi:hypothetical protein